MISEGLQNVISTLMKSVPNTQLLLNTKVERIELELEDDQTRKYRVTSQPPPTDSDLFDAVILATPLENSHSLQFANDQLLEEMHRSFHSSIQPPPPPSSPTSSSFHSRKGKYSSEDLLKEFSREFQTTHVTMVSGIVNRQHFGANEEDNDESFPHLIATTDTPKVKFTSLA